MVKGTFAGYFSELRLRSESKKASVNGVAFRGGTLVKMVGGLAGVPL
jgi:hypothetical protein